MTLKITSWNIEHSNRLIGNNLSETNEERRRRASDTVRDIDPDILCLLEAPQGEEAAVGFAQTVLNNEWVPILLNGPGNIGADEDKYDIRGTQWIWFFVKAALANQCRLQPPAVWQSYVGLKRWNVNYWGKIRPSMHSHYRHPQVLLVDLDNGAELELIGVHLKSKINRKRITRDADENLTGAYLEEALKARVKLATEARNIRRYIDARFNQNPNPGIMIMGDGNDGPGQDFIEKNYMFFDLISNLQGNVMDATRFFNHALFDFEKDLRWTAKYRDEILNIPASQNPLLIDHILMSQPVVNGALPLRAHAGSGLVEHEAFERGNAGALQSRHTSDHRPVSIILS